MEIYLLIIIHEPNFYISGMDTAKQLIKSYFFFNNKENLLLYKKYYASSHKIFKVKTKKIKKPIFDIYNNTLIHYEIDGTIWNDFKKQQKTFSIYHFDETTKMLQFVKI